MVIFRTLKSWAAPAATLVGLIIIWELVTRIFEIPRFLLPAPTGVIDTMLARADTLLMHTQVTLTQTLIGYGVAIVIGIPLAVAIVYSNFLERTVYPLLVSMQSVPKIAIAPLLVMWMGFGMGPKIVLIVLICLFPITISTAAGLKSTPAEYMELSRALDASAVKTFAKVRFPAAMPQIFVGLKVGISLAVIGAVIGEFIGADRGLGFIIVLSGGMANTTLAFASIFLLALMSIVLFYILVGLERAVVPWAKEEEERGLQR